MAALIKKLVLITIIGLMATGAIVYYLHNRNVEHTDDAAIEARVVYVSPKVSGYVTGVTIEDNKPVKAGDVLLEIDPRDYEIAVKQAEANIAAVTSGLSASNESYESSKITAPSNIEAAKAMVAKAEAEYVRTSSDYNRKSKMGDLVISKQGLIDARSAMQSALSALNDAKAGLVSAETAPRAIASAQAMTEQAQAEVKRAEAALEQAKLNLEHTKIVAPFDGHVTKRTVEPGTFVQPGQQVITLVSDDYWVVANFKETQLDRMKTGDPVDITIDAYPDQDYKGHVASFQKGTGARFSAFPPENATGNFVKVVQRVPVKILFDQQPDPTLSIGPGMSVLARVNVQ